MRVEGNGNGDTATIQMLINQLREITGIQDLQMLQGALDAGQGDVGHAVRLLTAKAPEVHDDPCEPQDAGPHEEVWEGQKGLPNDDLQAAIELSLQESHNAQEEEREFNRALEASVEENLTRAKRKWCEAQSEACSPADWIRQDDWPVGIRNVGNTCWFSAVIQSLFHLPVFRRLVLNYCLSERVLEKCRSHSDKRNIAFMQELRCLFALMVGSNRKFVDPSAAVELLRDAFRTSEAQQDVSEFTHKLLDWLEDAFQLAAKGNNPEDKKKNPMVQLFYGTFVTERKHEGKTLSNIEQFGQYPLQVNGFSNLDECLEGAMVEREIESLHSDQTIVSGRERWFSKLPPVLTFELSRFEFNTQLGRPEKIHKKLEFPQIIYMDRYLHRNIDQAHGRRGEVKRLKEQLAALQQKLERYKNYGSGPVKYPLADMLQFMLEFATTKPTSPSQAEDLRTTGASPTPTGPESPSEDSSQTKPGNTGPPVEALPSACQRTPIYKPFTQCRLPTDCPPDPAPHSISDEELHHIKACLQRWRTEVENSINELKASIDRVSQVLEGMYSDNSLCQVPYRLHAVLVHEGQASAGHYWAYIYDHATRRWMKYNDISITESAWDELVRDSYGGMTNASAYCLMYIDDKLSHLIAEDTDDETGQVLQGMDSLPPILRRFVHEDNRWFQQEISEWEEQFCQMAPPQVEPVPAAVASPESPIAVVPAATEAAKPPPGEEPESPAPQPEPREEEGANEGVGNGEEGKKEGEEEPVQSPRPEPSESPAPLVAQPPECLGSEPAAAGGATVTVDSDLSQNSASAAATSVPEEQSQNQCFSPRADMDNKASEDPDLAEQRAALQGQPEIREPEAAQPGPQGPESEPEQQDADQEEGPARRRQSQQRRPTEDEVSEVEIPNVGRILVRADADGYNEEMMLTPAMQGIILAIAKARQAFDTDGPEAGLIKAFHEEYSRLHELSQEETTPQEDVRLQHALVYFFQNKAPNRVVERTLLEQFTDRNLSFDDRAISIMREARSKLRLIKPEDMDMDEYLQWHEDYRMFRTVFVYLLTGLEQYQHGKVREALNYLAHAYQNNARLLRKGEKCGMEQSLIAVYRRKCLVALNDSASRLFRGSEETEVEDAIAIMNDAIIPCLHLMACDTALAPEDRDVMDTIRSHWCSCLGQDMDDSLQVKLGEFLPRVLDCSAEMVVLKDPPKVHVSFPHDLCSRLAAVMESIHNTSIVIVK